MATYTFEERRYKEKIEKEVSLFAGVHFPSHTVIKVEQDYFKEWNITIFQDKTLLYSRCFPKWSKALRYYENENQPAPTVGMQIGLF